MPPKGKKGSPDKSPGKKSSPDKSKKGSPEKKGSPGKKGGKAVEDEGPPPDVECQTDPSTTCLICTRKFSSAANLQSHLLTIDHRIPEAPEVGLCRTCNTYVERKNFEWHKCCKYRTVFLDQILSSQLVKKGPPNICLLCRGKQFPSRVGLMIHLMAVHSVNKSPGRCADCAFEHEELIKYETLDDLPCDPPDLDRHIEKAHLFGHASWAKVNCSGDTALRRPYACPLCSSIFDTNAEFHAHVLNIHATRERYDYPLKICVTCQRMNKNDNCLHNHVRSVHVNQFNSLAAKLSNAGHYTKFVDLLHTCASCWSVFEYDFELQAHLIVHHSSCKPWVCGWCQRNFFYSGSVREIWGAFLKHERGHAYELHRRALDLALTEIPLPEINPEDVPDEPDEPLAEDEKSKKKSPKKDSPSKKSDNKKSPDKGKKGGSPPGKKGKK